MPASTLVQSCIGTGLPPRLASGASSLILSYSGCCLQAAGLLWLPVMRLTCGRERLRCGESFRAGPRPPMDSESEIARAKWLLGAVAVFLVSAFKFTLGGAPQLVWSWPVRRVVDLPERVGIL